MDKPKCRVCGEKHWSYEAHAFESPKKKPAAPGVPAKEKVPELKSVDHFKIPGGKCPECGSTAQTFADAEKWDRIRKKQRKRMAKKRKDRR